MHNLHAVLVSMECLGVLQIWRPIVYISGRHGYIKLIEQNNVKAVQAQFTGLQEPMGYIAPFLDDCQAFESACQQHARIHYKQQLWFASCFS